MGKFDGILICSDWDGTLFDGEKVPDEAIEAIRYFQNNGGKFTLCSGRPPFYMKDLSSIVKPNTYALALNGSIICDLDNNYTLCETFADKDAYLLAAKLLSSGIKIRRLGVFAKGISQYLWKTPEEFMAQIDELMLLPTYKITLTTEIKSDGERLIDFADKTEKGRYSVHRSAEDYAEIILTEASKGQAALRLKEITGSKLLVCMGDYENDISMFERADVSYAPENAIPKIKALATHLTVSVSDAAVAKVIADIEKRYI